MIIKKAFVNTIFGRTKLIEDSGREVLILPGGMILNVKIALYCSLSLTNLLKFKVIYFYITTSIIGEKYAHKKLPTSCDCTIKILV